MKFIEADLSYRDKKGYLAAIATFFLMGVIFGIAITALYIVW